MPQVREARVWRFYGYLFVFGSFLFNRTLKQFLACKDLKSSEGLALVEKMRHQAPSAVDRILEAIPKTRKPHSDVLKDICREVLGDDSDDMLLERLDNHTTLVRKAAKSLLSESQEINPAKLFKKLHNSEENITEVIDILDHQKETVAPELYVKNALKLDSAYANRLFQMAQTQAHRVDMSSLNIDVDTLTNPDIKIMLIRFLTVVNNPDSARLLMRFLSDPSKIIVIKALSALKTMSIPYDPSPVVPCIPEMREEDQDDAFEILKLKLSEDKLPTLTMLLTGKSDRIRKKTTQLLLPHITVQGLDKLLRALDVHEWWGKEQAVKCLLELGGSQLFKAASKLTQSENEFVRSTAEQLAANISAQTGDITTMIASLLHENWQVRERAIESAGNSESREALEYLGRVIEKYPESSIAVLHALQKLGFSKGLEVASRCLRMKEAAIQREALKTMGSLVSARYALNVRKAIVKMVPRLQVTVRDTAREVCEDISKRFSLPSMNVDEDSLFETRLLKIEQNQQKQNDQVKQNADKASVEQTAVVNYQHVEELKPGDYWMERYKVVREVGRGAMGRVMLVDDEMVGESMILKFMHPELLTDAKAKERFIRELKYSRKISHPNVIRIHEYLVFEGISAISMEYFESYGLDHLIKKGLLKTQRHSLAILYQVCDGMFEAHQQQVIHRDLKPSNILVNAKGLAKVVDFGIASAASESEATLTSTGMIIGTPAYLSPERAKGLEADERSDIYALGIIAYTMFTGSAPYKGEPMSLLFQHIEGKAKPVNEVNAALDEKVGKLVKKMMAVDIDQRFQTMREVRDSIRQLM